MATPAKTDLPGSVAGHRPGLSNRTAAIAVIALTAVAVLRIVSAYPVLSQAFDEPAHIACGMEWLDQGTFTLEPLHPPLPRVMAALGPYLAGARLPRVQWLDAPGGSSADITTAGTAILNQGGHYWRNLALARLGEMPFLIVGVILVFVWTRSLLGNGPAVVAVFFFTTLPTILAFAGLAYVDFSLAVFLPVTLFAFTRWLESPTLGGSVGLGTAAGLAVISNLTALLFLPVCLVPAMACWCWVRTARSHRGRLARGAVIAAVMAVVVIWGGYRFSVKPLNQAFARPVEDIDKLRMPAPVRWIAYRFVQVNPPVPAPEFIKGIVAGWRQNADNPPSYALGTIRRGGFWYFYFFDLGVKTPLPFLLLALLGIAAALAQFGSGRDWQAFGPAISVLAILVASMFVKVNLGIRHILFIYVLLAIAAAAGGEWLWQQRARWPRLAAAALVVLIGWQAVSSLRAHPDYIAYFNELAERHPENFLLWGTDFVSGQDSQLLLQTLRARGVSHLSLRLHSSADLASLGFPVFDTLAPYQHVTGWVAVDLLYLRTGNAMWNMTDSDGYQWLDAYQPQAQVGKTIRLYYIPDSQGTARQSPQ